jgi:hypothetical protein
VKTLLTLAQGFGFGVSLGAVALLGLGRHLGAAVAVAGFVLGIGALITSYQGGKATSNRP